MAIKYQFNKTSLNEINKQLKVRTKALPTIKNKESALRLEVQKAKDKAARLEERLLEMIARQEYMAGLWNEFDPALIAVRDVQLAAVKIAGVKIPELKQVLFDVKPYNLFGKPLWYIDGVEILKNIVHAGIEHELCVQKMIVLDHARKKTTQKVNLYEKVQIPGYSEAIRKIKRFLEDEENLSKSAQKIVKKRQQEETEK